MSCTAKPSGRRQPPSARNGYVRVEDRLGKIVGTAQQLSGLFASDQVLKSGIADYAFEHYEIASYKMLIAAAGEAGEHPLAMQS